MSLSAKEQCLAQEIASLKERVKKEMKRRAGNGSLTIYAGTDYDYTVAPEVGGQMLVEHVNKIIVPMNQINNTGFTEKSVGDIAEAMDTVEVQLSTYEQTNIRPSVNDCATSCSGTCYTGCYTACSSYSSCSCGYDCYTGCSGDACKNNCGTSCNKSCAITCGEGGACGMSCWAKCNNSCHTGCVSCTGGCNYSYGGPN